MTFSNLDDIVRAWYDLLDLFKNCQDYRESLLMSYKDTLINTTNDIGSLVDSRNLRSLRSWLSWALKPSSRKQLQDIVTGFGSHVAGLLAECDVPCTNFGAKLDQVHVHLTDCFVEAKRIMPQGKKGRPISEDLHIPDGMPYHADHVTNDLVYSLSHILPFVKD